MCFPLRTPHIVLSAGKKGHCVLRWPRFSVPPLGAGTDGKTSQELIGGGSQLIIISGFKRKDLRIYFFFPFHSVMLVVDPPLPILIWVSSLSKLSCVRKASAIRVGKDRPGPRTRFYFGGDSSLVL